jgi:large subunit ribosomal protein L13
MKTFRLRNEDVQRRWFLLDASNEVLGKLAVKAANVLMGKEKPTFTPGVDSGDFVIVTNAQAVKATGRKEERKLYRRHSPWVGSMVEETLSKVRLRKPETLVYLAVRRMLPKNNTGVHQFRRLKVFAGSEHPHAAQAPVKVEMPKKVRPPRKVKAERAPAGRRADKMGAKKDKEV